MISGEFPSGTEVLEDLGSDFVRVLIDAVDGARQDIADLREFRSEWFVTFSSRCIANLVHDRLWARIIEQVDAMDQVTVLDREPRREVAFGYKYVFRVKRHHKGDKISCYPTDGAKEFWSNEPALEGCESFSLALGYMWDRDTRVIGEPVVSLQQGTRTPIWAVKVRDDSAAPSGFTWEPVVPVLPRIDTSGVAADAPETLPGS